jgi:hypothetical protein
MATKSSKTSKRSVDSGERYIAKDLRPSDSETKYAGSEPVYNIQPETDRRRGSLALAFNWYSRFYGTKQAKEILCDYLTHNDRTDLAKKMAKVSDNQIITTYAWLARLTLRGLDLLEDEQQRLDSEINRLVVTLTAAEEYSAFKPKVEEAPQSNRPNVQEIMRDRAREAQGELEGLLDEFMGADLKLKSDGRVLKELNERNILPQHISMLVEIWQKKINEFTEVLETDDRQLREAYAHYNKTQVKALIKFCEAIIADLHGYSSVKKAAKAPRARKAVPVEKFVKNLKYLKKFEDVALKLKLESISPTKLHGCSECWLYNTATRKLIHLVADDYAKSLTVKGNSVSGFDKVKSETKTLRKPAMLTEFMKVGKPAKRTQFKELTTTPTEPNGRFNENIIILQAF